MPSSCTACLPAGVVACRCGCLWGGCLPGWLLPRLQECHSQSHCGGWFSVTTQYSHSSHPVLPQYPCSTHATWRDHEYRLRYVSLNFPSTQTEIIRIGSSMSIFCLLPQRQISRIGWSISVSYFCFHTDRSRVWAEVCLSLFLFHAHKDHHHAHCQMM